MSGSRAPVSQGLVDDLVDQLSPLGHITTRRMFGSVGLYCDGQVFGLIYEDVLYLKVDDETRGSYEAAGCGPFTYPKRDGVQIIAAYHRAPDHLMDDADDLRIFARNAIAAGRRAPTITKKPTRARSPRGKGSRLQGD